MLRFILLLSILWGSAAWAQDAARPEAMVAFTAEFSSGTGTARSARTHVQAHGPVQAMIASAVSERLGSQWVGVALRIAKIESGMRCNARNRKAVGVFQNTNPQMFGVSRAAALTCAGGVRAGVAHMALCIAKGARTARQMMICHNTGSPFARRVERAYRVALARM